MQPPLCYMRSALVIRVRQSREAARKKPGQAVAESYELLHKVVGGVQALRETVSAIRDT